MDNKEAWVRFASVALESLIKRGSENSVGTAVRTANLMLERYEERFPDAGKGE